MPWGLYFPDVHEQHWIVQCPLLLTWSWTWIKTCQNQSWDLQTSKYLAILCIIPSHLQCMLVHLICATVYPCVSVDWLMEQNHWWMQSKLWCSHRVQVDTGSKAQIASQSSGLFISFTGAHIVQFHSKWIICETSPVGRIQVISAVFQLLYVVHRWVIINHLPSSQKWAPPTKSTCNIREKVTDTKQFSTIKNPMIDHISQIPNCSNTKENLVDKYAKLSESDVKANNITSKNLDVTLIWWDQNKLCILKINLSGASIALKCNRPKRMESYKNEKSNILTPNYKQMNPTLFHISILNSFKKS